MRNSLRVVLDTNVIVSAALSSVSPPERVLEYVIRNGSLLTSVSMVSEIKLVLLRPRFQRYLSWQERDEFLAAVLEAIEPVEVTHSVTACRDPKDDKFLELARSGHATHIIGGDRDLLDLHPFRGIPIRTPGAFLAAVGD